MSMKWWFGPNSWACKTLGLCWHEKPTPTPPSPPLEKITLEICPVSESLPTVHCRKQAGVLIEEFVKGTEPTSRCAVHVKPTGPPLVGCSVYSLIDFSLEENEKYADQVDEAGGLAAEIFGERSWDPKFVFEGAQYCPHIYRIHSVYSEYDTLWPYYDLTRPDEEVRDKYRRIAALHRERQIIDIIKLRDFCSYKGTNKRRTPWDSNIQKASHGFGGPIIGGQFCDQIPSWQEKGMAWLDALGQSTIYWWNYRDIQFWVSVFGVDSYYMPMSEAEYMGDRFEDETADQYAVRCRRELYKFHSAYVDMLAACGVPKNNIIINSQFQETFGLPTLYEVHGFNSPERMNKYASMFGPSVCPNGDGPDADARGIKSTMGGKTTEPSIEQAREIRKFLIEKGIPIYCTWARSSEKNAAEGIQLKYAGESMPMLAALANYENK